MSDPKNKQPVERPEQCTLESRAVKAAQSTSRWNSFQQVWQLLAHYRWNQIAIRARNIGLNRLRRNKVIGPIPTPSDIETCTDRFKEAAEALLNDFQDHIQHRQSKLADGKIVLLNREVKLGQPLDWNLSKINELPHLWRFQLQYQEFLLGHLANGTPEELEDRWEDIIPVLKGWISAFQPQSTIRNSDAWHPFCISRRIPVWISILAIWNSKTQHRAILVNSLFQQASWLSKNLETDLGGNHLLENLTALALAGNFLKTPESNAWIQIVEDKLPKELKSQILSSGEHFERAPMYHCQVLRNLMLVALTSRDSSLRLSDLCRNAAEGMLDFLLGILHPDDEIPLFGDSGFGEAPSVSQILHLARLNQMPIKTAAKGVSVRGNYWITRTAGDHTEHLIFDAGSVAAAHLPAHAHCDQLGIELSVGKQRWFVDSGNYNYEDDDMRQFCRSSLAHNVTTVNNSNSCNIWSRFRMGFRGSVTGLSSGTRGQVNWATGAHNGYRRLGVEQIKRLIAMQDDSFLVVADFAKTRKKRKLISYLHLAPQLNLKAVGQPNQFVLSDGLNTRFISFFGVREVTIDDGWYCRGFGFREANKVFVYHANSINQPFGWLLSHEQNFAPISLSNQQISLMPNSRGFAGFEWDFSISTSHF